MINKITKSFLFILIITIFFFYEYIFRGSKILLKEENITLFPYNLIKLCSKLIPTVKYKYNINKQKVMAIRGIFLSGFIFLFFCILLFYFIHSIIV